MLKTLIILHDNPDWLEPIKQSLNKENINYQDIVLGDGLLDIASKPEDAVYFNRVSPSSHLRGKPDSIEHAISYLGHLNAHNKKVINNLPTQYLELNKFAQYLALEKAGIKIPRTLAALGKESILAAAKKISFPLILKPNRGGSGAGVEIFYNMAEIKQYLKQNIAYSRDGITLIQQYIAPKGGVIRRAEFIGGEFVYVVKIQVSDDFNLCPADSCKVSTSFCPIGESKEHKFTIEKDFKVELLGKYLNFIKQEQYDIAGIEFVIGEDDVIYTYDVNANTNYNSEAEAIAGISAYDKLAKYLLTQL
ncbi:MAG: alpha-L-glutamate ligase [Alphaproteobacteria bacterium]|jgi:hypothetical protein|nr:alpha-L-glutamate ligase [Alphaproteobacteria bacterium]